MTKPNRLISYSSAGTRKRRSSVLAPRLPPGVAMHSTKPFSYSDVIAEITTQSAAC